MAWTNQQIIVQALAEIGIADYVYTLTTGQLDNALIRLGAMMASWDSKGLTTGYIQGSALGASSGIEDATAEAAAINLAVRLAPGYGKVVSPQTTYTAKMAYDGLLMPAAAATEMILDDIVPLGEGNRPGDCA